MDVLEVDNIERGRQMEEVIVITLGSEGHVDVMLHGELLVSDHELAQASLCGWVAPPEA